MNQNPNQRFQKQFQKQMDDSRQRQMQAAWQQQQAGGYPVRERSGCARAFTFLLTFLVGSVVLAVFCGGGGYLALGLMTGSDDTAIIGAVAGGVLAMILALGMAFRAAR